MFVNRYGNSKGSIWFKKKKKKKKKTPAVNFAKIEDKKVIAKN